MLVIANQTVLSDELLDRIRKRAGAGPASFLIVAPQDDDEEHADADRRLRRALSELRGEGIDAHGQVVHPDPYTAAHARRERRARRRDHRLDVPGRAQRLAAARPRRAPAQGHEAAGRPRRSRPCRRSRWRAHERARRDELGGSSTTARRRSTTARASRRRCSGCSCSSRRRSCSSARSSRSTSSTASSTTPFGGHWPPDGFHRPVFVAGINTLILVTSSFTMHWADTSIKKGNRAGLQAGLVLTFLPRPHVPAHPGDRVPPHRLQHEATPRSPRPSSGSPACTARTSSSA